MVNQKKLNKLHPTVDTPNDFLGKAASVMGTVKHFTSGKTPVSASVGVQVKKGDGGAMAGFIAAASNYSPPIPGDVKETLDKALSDISSAMADIKTIGMTDADLHRFLSARLEIPFNDVALQMSFVFQPKPKDFTEDPMVYPKAKKFIGRILKAMTDPFAKLMKTQTGRSTSFDSLEQILYGGPGELGPGSQELANKIFDQTKLAMRSLFISGDTNDNNLAGLFTYAIEETLPAIDEEIDTLHAMARLVTALMEDTSQLPPTFIPELPNIVVLDKLRAAKVDIDQVLFELRQYQTFNQPVYGSATSLVCSAKEASKHGTVPSSYRKYLKELFGMTDLQLNILLTAQFTPDPNYIARLEDLIELNEQAQAFDKAVMELHNNLLNTTAVMAEVEQIGIGNILAMIIEVFRNQISLLVAQLEAKVGDFAALINASSGNPTDRLELNGRLAISSEEVGVEFLAELRRSSSKSLTDFIGPSEQLALYTQLSALCYLMRRAGELIRNIERITEAQSAVMRTILDFVGRYKDEVEVCGTSDGARVIQEDLTHFIDAFNARLSGIKGTNELVCYTGQQLIHHIRLHIRFLECIRDKMRFGKKEVTEQLDDGGAGAGGGGGGGSAMPGAKNLIMNTVRTLPQMKATAKTFDVRALLGLQKNEYKGLDVLMNGLQKIMQLCPNASTKEAVQQIKTRFDAEFSIRKSKATTMGSLDETPKRALQVAVQQRVISLNKAMEALKTLISSNVVQVSLQTHKDANAIAVSAPSFEIKGAIKLQVSKKLKERRGRPDAVQDPQTAKQQAPFDSGGLGGSALV